MGGTVVGRWQHGGGHVVRIGVVGIRITAGIHAVLWMLMFLLLRWTSSNGSGPSALLLLRSRLATSVGLSGGRMLVCAAGVSTAAARSVRCHFGSSRVRPVGR